MTNRISKYLIAVALTLCAFGAQSQIALEGVPVFPDSVEGGSCREHRVEMRQDTLHITPAMIEEMQHNKPVDEFEMDIFAVAVDLSQIQRTVGDRYICFIFTVYAK